MKQPKYDIFISYRRDGGAQYARTLQLMLEKKGYKAFLDYDELKDEKFSPQIEAAIKNSTIYIILLTKGSMARCANEGDWVRREIEIAVKSGKRIVPVNPDGTYDGIPDNVPQEIRSAIEDTQHSEVNFGQTLNATVDLMVRNRIKPYIHHRSWVSTILIITLAAVLAVGVLFTRRWIENDELQSLKEKIVFNGEPIEWASKITTEQLRVMQEIISSMQLIEGGEFTQGALPMDDGKYHENVEAEFEIPASKISVGSFYLSKFEVTIGQWNTIMKDKREGDPKLPVSNVTFFQAKEFAEQLTDLTTLDFRLPTESEWEYAAKGGNEPEGFMFAGSNNPGEVAWYSKNSNGHAHSGTLGVATINDLFNMSGNVSEWCNTKFKPYDTQQLFNGEGAMTVRGGNYDSQEYEITVTHREPAMPDTSIPTLGFRVALTK